MRGIDSKPYTTAFCRYLIDGRVIAIFTDFDSMGFLVLHGDYGF